MLIWNDTLQQLDIRIKGIVRSRVDKFLGGTAFPTKNTTAAQAEMVVQNYINPLIADTGYHVVIHIFSFPKKTEESNPFEYVIWLGSIGDEPPVLPGNTYWWEPAER